MLDELFAPRSIAVVGVAREEGKVGHFIFDNLRSGGYPGAIYPVNPKASEIHGVTCYPDVRAIPERPDLAVIAVPSAKVGSVIEDCAAAQVPTAVIITAGFKESGPDGAALEREIVATALKGGVRILGPNCLGLLSTHSRMNASFSATMPPEGGVAFISQSGALGTAILDWAASERIGLSHFVSLGNRADIDEADLLDACAQDPRTRVIALYVESVAEGARLLEVARKVLATKPTVVLKSGTSDAGARAVSSHTGSLAGSRAAYDAAFLKAGFVKAHSVEHLFDLASAFSRQPLPGTGGLAIITNAGGPAVIATDSCEEHEVALASFEHETIEAIRAIAPAAAALYNPVDILGDAQPALYRDVLRIVADDPGVGSLLCIVTPQAMTAPEGIAEAIAEVAVLSDKTFFSCFMGGKSLGGALDVLATADVPNFPFPERAVDVLAGMNAYMSHRVQDRTSHPDRHADKATVSAILQEARASNHAFVTEHAASRIAAAYGITVPREGVAADHSAALRLAGELGYPLVAKIASPDILHKTDVGGVRTGITSDKELLEAYDHIMSRARSYAPDAHVEGLHLQEFVSRGREVIIGVDRDPTFGPVLMFGSGGIGVEVLKDVTFRLCPVTPREAANMITEIRSYGILRGVRGRPSADIDSIVDAIVAVSALVTEFPQVVELDINPLIVGDAGQGSVAADIRIGIGGSR